jgi:hypothetical protein
MDGHHVNQSKKSKLLAADKNSTNVAEDNLHLVCKLIRFSGYVTYTKAPY